MYSDDFIDTPVPSTENPMADQVAVIRQEEKKTGELNPKLARYTGSWILISLAQQRMTGRSSSMAPRDWEHA